MVDMKEAEKQARIEAKNEVNEMKMKVWKDTPGHTKIDLMKVAAACGQGSFNNPNLPTMDKSRNRSAEVILLAIELAWAQHCVTIIEPTSESGMLLSTHIGFKLPEE